MDVREELIELLTRLVMDGVITEQEAIEIVLLFDEQGDLPEGWQLPLVFSEAIPANLRELANEAMIFYAGLQSRDDPDVAQTVFIEMVTDISASLAARKIALKSWHKRMVRLVIDYLAQQAQDGAQRAVVAEDEDTVVNLLFLQLAYLSRFADTVAQDKLSAGQIRERSKLYAGEGRALFYQFKGQTNALYGWVEDYIAVDDKNTCGPCAAAEAQGPYLPGVGPMPGRVCLGRGYCRCQRLLRYDPIAYARLGGT